jgi:hypothetical protein
LQADVFSFGVMAYEVMHRYIMLSAISVLGSYEELEAYTARVAAGYRPPLHGNLPASITSIIQVIQRLCSNALLRHLPSVTDTMWAGWTADMVLQEW